MVVADIQYIYNCLQELIGAAKRRGGGRERRGWYLNISQARVLADLGRGRSGSVSCHLVKRLYTPGAAKALGIQNLLKQHPNIPIRGVFVRILDIVWSVAIGVHLSRVCQPFRFKEYPHERGSIAP